MVLKVEFYKHIDTIVIQQERVQKQTECEPTKPLVVPIYEECYR